MKPLRRTGKVHHVRINFGRIEKAQRLMVEHGMIGLMIMNHDDYRYFFGDVRVQPRAIIPFSGPPILIAFVGEEPELRQALGGLPVKIFTHVGEQIADVRKTFQSLFGGPPAGGERFHAGGKPRVGMQMWFHTPGFLMDLFRRVNPQIELVSSDPVMDELRMVKEPEEVEMLRRAQAVAAQGMALAREMLQPGVTGHEIATEVLHAMMKAGAEGTSTPIHVNSGIRSCWIHGKVDRNEIRKGDLVVIDLTPQVEGYCANLARTFVLGEPDASQTHLLETYREMHEATRAALRPGVTSAELDALGREICERRGLGEHHIDGISHGIGLRFEEPPASTIIKPHQSLKLREGMTVTVGHTVLAIPGFGGARFEDICLVTPAGGEILHAHPMDWSVPVTRG
jgi:Xaa-Pro dipeptidase